jgi:hypothetical protein
MSGRYPYPVKPEGDESLWGYTHRLAEENLVYRHVQLRRRIGIVGNSAECARKQLNGLSEISGVGFRMLRRMQHGERDKQDAIFFGNRVRRQRLEFVRSRLCPLCYLSSGYHNRIFDLRILRACPIHEIELVEYCPTCNIGLTWHRNAISCCSKGHTLWTGHQLDFEPRKIKRSLRAERLIFERCGQPISGPSILAALPENVRNLPLEGQLVLFALLGDAARDFPTDYRRGRQLRYDHVPTWEMLNDGLALAEGFPESFIEWLTARYDPSNNGPSDMGKRIQPLQHALSDSKPTENPALKLLLGPLTKFARERGHSGKITSPWAEPPDPAKGQMNLLQAAEMMKVRLRRVRTIAEREGWARFGPKQDTGATLVSSASVQRWVNEGGDDLTCREAARLLGVAESEVMDFAKNRVVGTFRAGRNGNRGTTRNWNFKRCKILELKKELQERVMTRAPTGRIVSYRQYRSMTRGPAVAYWKIVKAVRGGRLQLVTWPHNGRLEETTFCLGDLDLALRGTTKRAPRKLKNRNNSTMKKMYSLRALEIRFSTSRRIIEAAIKRGYLRATIDENGDPQICDTDLGTFERAHVFVGRMAKDRKIPSMVVLIHDLKEAGILPEANVADSADGLLYRVADVRAWDTQRNAA